MMKLNNLMRRATLMATSAIMGMMTLQAQSPLAVTWQMGQNNNEQGVYSSRFVFKNITSQPLDNDWQFFFSQFSRRVQLPNDAPLDISEVSTGYFRIVPNARYRSLAAGDSIVLDMTMNGTMVNVCYQPVGGHVVLAGDMRHPQPVSIAHAPLDRPGQWEANRAYPDGNYMYAFNAAINDTNDGYTGNDYDIFPTPKQVQLTGGYTAIGNLVSVSTGKLWAQLRNHGLKGAKALLTAELKSRGIYVMSGQKTTIELRIDKKIHTNAEYYALTIDDGHITIVAPAEQGLNNGVKTLVAALDHSQGHRLQNAQIIDWPDLPYRGFMLDIARNFTGGLPNLKRFVDLLAYYKINTLQFHFADDEAWRIEIPGFPELTQVASRRGCTLDEIGYLAQIFDGNGNPDDLTQSANGYLTRADFIELLRYAHQRGVRIIPEIETPGHARAAIVAMKNRAHSNPQAEQFRLWDEKSTSVYTSAQSYHDNVLNVASDDVYRFVDRVVQQLQLMYKEAGLKLEIVHLGGDEVPGGAWDKAPDVQALMQREGLTTQHQVHEYYIRRISDLLAQRGIRIEGWQEVAMNHDANFNSVMIPRVAGVNAWSTIGKKNVIPYQLANDGYPVILSNVTNFYMDMAYSWHQDERGLHWGGKVDEFDSWSALPWNIYASVRMDYDGSTTDVTTAANGKPALEKPQNIIGVQAQLWGETLRNFDQVQYLCLPKMLGLSERGWNAAPAWAEDLTNATAYNDARRQYNLKIGTRELPLLHRKGYHFRVGQPGIKVENGKLIANAPYPGVTIVYTLDGSQPTPESPRWTAPVAVSDNVKVIKARAYYLGHHSVTTYLWR